MDIVVNCIEWYSMKFIQKVTKPGSTCQEGTWVAPNAKQIKQTSLFLATTRQAVCCMTSRFAWPRNESYECWIFRRCRSVSLSPFTCLCWTGRPSYQRRSGGRPLWRGSSVHHNLWGSLSKKTWGIQDAASPNVPVGRTPSGKEMGSTKESWLPQQLTGENAAKKGSFQDWLSWHLIGIVHLWWGLTD